MISNSWQNVFSLKSRVLNKFHIFQHFHEDPFDYSLSTPMRPWELEEYSRAVSSRRDKAETKQKSRVLNLSPHHLLALERETRRWRKWSVHIQLCENHRGRVINANNFSRKSRVYIVNFLTAKVYFAYRASARIIKMSTTSCIFKYKRYRQ